MISALMYADDVILIAPYVVCDRFAKIDIIVPVWIWRPLSALQCYEMCSNACGS